MEAEIQSGKAVMRSLDGAVAVGLDSRSLRRVLPACEEAFLCAVPSADRLPSPAVADVRVGRVC